jgi:hypothetical protein
MKVDSWKESDIVQISVLAYALAPACLAFLISRCSSSGKSRLLFLSLASRQSVVQVPMSVFVSAATRTSIMLRGTVQYPCPVGASFGLNYQDATAKPVIVGLSYDKRINYKW